MTNEEEILAKAEKKREANRRYRAAHPDKVQAQRQKWRENNPEKYRESQRKAVLKHRQNHRDELNAQALVRWAKYYAKNRDEVLARQKEYVQQNPDKILARRKKYQAANQEKCKQWQKTWYEKNRERIRAKNREYAREHREEIRAARQRNADKISAARKVKYAANPTPARERTRAYHARAIASRQMAEHVCPAFRFMLELKATKKAVYKLHGGDNYAFVQRAISCPALTAADARLCPMVAAPAIKRDEMLETCTMPNVFKIVGAWTAARAQARTLRAQQSQK